MNGWTPVQGIDAGELQGNILPGFNTNYQVFVSLTTTDPSSLPAAAAWAASLAPQMTTSRDVATERTAADSPAKSAVTAPWLAVAISARLLTAQHPDLVLADELLTAGMAQTATGLGDPRNGDDWKVGSTSKPVDVLLILAANDSAVAEKRADELADEAATHHLECTYRELGSRLPGLREHFGFRDGLSQPTVVGWDANGDVWPGEFIFGYPRVDGGPPTVGAFGPDADLLTHGGSLLSFRRLAQDVEAFQAFCSQQTGQLSGQLPGLDADRLAALIVGRWPSGAPVDASSTGGDPGLPINPNDFTFVDDGDGIHCPLGAHIRKVNPRKGKRDVTVVPRILRRGIPFGRPLPTSDERGLLFVAYQTSLVDQFRRLVASWMNDPTLPSGDQSGQDLVVGQGNSRRLYLRRADGEIVTVIAGANRWVTATGGSYLFAPSRRGLAAL